MPESKTTRVTVAMQDIREVSITVDVTYDQLLMLRNGQNIFEAELQAKLDKNDGVETSSDYAVLDDRTGEYIVEWS